MRLVNIRVTNGTKEPLVISTPDGQRPWALVPPGATYGSDDRPSDD